MGGRYSVRKPGWAVVSPTTGDRILIGACAAAWLALVGISVAAVVALADLGRGFHGGTGASHTPWVLYVVIIISALIILAAIPMLLRARRMTAALPVARSTGPGVRDGSGQPPAAEGAPHARTERLTALRPALAEAEVERIWLRGSLFLLGPLGLALIGVAAATYLMAIGHQGAAWTMYVLAGIVTAVLPLILWRYDRRLRRMLTETR